MYVMNKKWDSITNIAQCTSVYVSPEHEIKAVPTGGGAVYRLGQYETAEIARAVLNDLYIHVATGCTYQIRPTTISDYYNEIAERMNLNHLDLICEALDCSPTEILVREPNPEPRVRNRTGFEKPVTGQRKDGE